MVSDARVVVYLYPTQPPAVFVATQAQLIEEARDLAAQTDTFPGLSRILDFESAWTVLIRDKKAAHHFQDFHAARRHVHHNAYLTVHERSSLLSALDRLERGPRQTSSGG